MLTFFADADTRDIRHTNIRYYAFALRLIRLMPYAMLR